MGNGINNCVMYPGQRIAEMFFGKTITRHYIRSYDPESYKALLDGDLSLLKSYGEILAFISLGPFGAALAIGFKLGGVKIDLTDYTPIGAVMKYHNEIGRGFEDAYEAVEDGVKEYTKLLELGVDEMLKNFKKLGKISSKLGKDAAKKVAGMGKVGIDKVSDLIDRGFNDIGNVVNKGLGEIEKAWGSLFGWLPF